MLGFIVSTLSFSAAVYGLNKYYGIIDQDQSHPHKARILLWATLISLGAGWVVDEVDGDAAKPHPSMSEVIKSGDPVLMSKMIIGIN